MLVNEIKPIGKVGKNLLENKNAYEIIETIIEMPMQKACKACKDKNIETSMSSANKKNIVKDNKKRINKQDLIEMNKKEKNPTFIQVGKGYAWLMLNYNTLSDENKKILFTLEEKYGEDTILFAKSCLIETINKMRKIVKLKPLTEEFSDQYADKFKKKQILLVYNNKYPRRSIFIRMPIDKSTSVEQVEIFFDEIITVTFFQQTVRVCSFGNNNSVGELSCCQQSQRN